MTAAEDHRENRVYLGILIGIVVGLAVAFTWLGYDQYQRSQDNHMQLIALAKTVKGNCESGNGLRHTLKKLLVTIEHYPSPVPVTPEVLHAEQRLYALLIAQIKFRSCNPLKGAAP